MSYKKLNNCFFLFGIVIILLLTVLISAVCFNDDFAFLFFPSCLISSVLCTAFFYRFNNGLISIIMGKFGKPSAKNKKYFDYDKSIVDNIDELKFAVKYGEKSFLFYKQNTREIYQVIKLSDRILIHKCFVENKKIINPITDYTSAESIKKSKNDKIIYFNAIKSVTYRFSETNFSLPVISIISERHRYGFIGLFEKIVLDEVKSFFGDICDVKTGASLKSVLSKNEQKEKTVFEYNVLCLISSISFPYVLYASVLNDDKTHILLSLFMMINVIVLVIAVLFAIIKADYFSLGFIENINDKRKDISFLYLALALPVLLMCSVQTVINIDWYIILIVIFAVPIILMYFLKVFNLNKLSKGAAVVKIIAVAGVFILTSSALVSGVNYIIPLKSDTQSYHITDRYTVHAKSGGEYHYVRIAENGEEKDLRVSSETYENKSDIIDAEKTTGLLGITYLSEKIK